MNEELKFTKNAILNTNKFNIVVHNEVLEKLGLSEQSFTQFKNEWNLVRERIYNSDSIEEIKDNMLILKDLFQENLWSKVNSSKYDYALVSIAMKMRSLYYYPNETSIDEYFEKIKVQFEKIQEEGFLYKAQIEREFKSHSFTFNNDDIRKAQDIVHKYAFSYIELTSNKEMDFLKQLDSAASSVCKKMNMDYRMIGLNKHLSVSKAPVDANYLGMYTTIKKHITLVNNNTAMNSTLLHEWIHAIDNIVLDKIKDRKISESIKNSYKSPMLSTDKIFSSHYDAIIEQSISIDGKNNKADSLFNAHHQLRNILTGIRNADQTAADQYIEERKYLATTKFWSILLKDDWYTLSNDTREKYTNIEMQNAINNFCAEPNEENKNYLGLQIKKRLNTSDKDSIEIIEANIDDIVKFVKPYIQQSQSSPVLKKSAIFELCEMHEDSLNVVLSKISKKLLNSSPQYINEPLTVNDNDYLLQPPELLARYFQSNVYSLKSQLYQITHMLINYDMSIRYSLPDKDFIEKKNDLLDSVSVAIGLEKNSVLKNITNIRKPLANNEVGSKLTY